MQEYTFVCTVWRLCMYVILYLPYCTAGAFVRSFVRPRSSSCFDSIVDCVPLAPCTYLCDLNVSAQRMHA